MARSPLSALARLTAVWLLAARSLAADEPPPGIELEAQARFTASSSLAPASGRVSQSSQLIDLSLPLAGSSAFGLGVDIQVERLQFRFHNFSQFLDGRPSPLSGASTLALQPTLLLTPSALWSVAFSGSLQYAGAQSARLTDSLLKSGSVAVVRQHSTRMKVGLGFEAEKRLDGSIRVEPFPLVDWRISDQWSLTSLDGQSGRLTFDLTGTLSVFGQLEYISRDLRLGRSASIPSGIMRYEAFPLCLGIRYSPSKRLGITMCSGAALAQQYRFADASGRFLRQSESTGSFTASLNLGYSF